MRANIVYGADAQGVDLHGSERRVLSYTNDMMVVEVRFDQNATGALHTHPHAQSTYVANGRFRFTIDGETVEVAQGDSITFESNVPHGVLCLEAGTLIDVFAPMRADFL